MEIKQAIACFVALFLGTIIAFTMPFIKTAKSEELSAYNATLTTVCFEKESLIRYFNQTYGEANRLVLSTDGNMETVMYYSPKTKELTIHNEIDGYSCVASKGVSSR